MMVPRLVIAPTADDVAAIFAQERARRAARLAHWAVPQWQGPEPPSTVWTLLRPDGTIALAPDVPPSPEAQAHDAWQARQREADTLTRLERLKQWTRRCGCQAVE